MMRWVLAVSFICAVWGQTLTSLPLIPQRAYTNSGPVWGDDGSNCGASRLVDCVLSTDGKGLRSSSDGYTSLDSGQLYFTNFTIPSIPTGSILKGITINLAVSGTSTCLTDTVVQLLGLPNATVNKATQAPLQSPATHFIYGGPAELWQNPNLLVSHLNPNIVLLYQFHDHCADYNPKTGNVDSITATVTFTTPPPPPASSTAISSQSEGGSFGTTGGSNNNAAPVPTPATFNPAFYGAIGGGVLFLAVIGLVAGLFIYKKRRAQHAPIELGRSNTASLVLENTSSDLIPRDQVYSGLGARSTVVSSQGSSRIAIPNAASNNAFEIQYKDVSMLNEIGAGNYGVVYKGKWGKREVAVKQLKNLSMEEQAKFVEEVNVMKNIPPHPYVICFLGVIKEPLSIVTLYYPNGSLEAFLKEPRAWKTKLQIMNDIAQGMQHLHANNIIHRDLAARNILLDKNFRAIISDFGFAKALQETERWRSLGDVGPLKWMAPESFLEKIYSKETDIWAFGVTCYEILEQKAPYQDYKAVEAVMKIVNEKLRLEFAPSYPKYLRSVLDQCFEELPTKRSSWTQIISAIQKATDSL